MRLALASCRPGCRGGTRIKPIPKWLTALALLPGPVVANADYVYTARAQITYALRVALEWIAFVPIALIAIAVMLLATVLYSIIWFVRRSLEGL